MQPAPPRPWTQQRRIYALCGLALVLWLAPQLALDLAPGSDWSHSAWFQYSLLALCGLTTGCLAAMAWFLLWERQGWQLVAGASALAWLLFLANNSMWYVGSSILEPLRGQAAQALSSQALAETQKKALDGDRSPKEREAAAGMLYRQAGLQVLWREAGGTHALYQPSTQAQQDWAETMRLQTWLRAMDAHRHAASLLFNGSFALAQWLAVVYAIRRRSSTD